MSENDPPETRPGRSAEEVHEEFLRRQEQDSSYTLEDLVEDFPQLAEQLRRCDSIHRNADSTRSVAGAPDLQHVLRGPQEPGLREGDAFDGYEIIRGIEVGGFGEVYLANQREFGREVALKILKADHASKDVLDRFEVERRALARMNHEYIAKVYDAGLFENGRPYFVMEFVDGQSLTRFCRERDLGLRDRLHLFRAVCEGVGHAHQRGVVHRDLKPANILVTAVDRKPVPKIIDFGLAKALDLDLSDETRITLTGQILGTLDYMSPEQAGSGAPVDRRTDVYSLGVVLYELLTGELPFEKPDDIWEFFRRLRQDDPPTPSMRVSRARKTDGRRRAADESPYRAPPGKLRAELDWIVMTALEKEPQRRYQSAADFASDVASYLNDEPTVARPPSRIYRLRKFVRRNRAAVTVGSVLGLAAMAILGLAVQGPLRKRNLYHRAVEAFHRYETIHSEVESGYRSWTEARGGVAPWAPYWHRTEEIAALERLRALVPHLEESFRRSQAALAGSLEDPYGNAARADVEAKLRRLRRLHEVEDPETSVAVSEIRERLPRSVSPTTASQFTITAEVRTDPADAAVYCFRYEEREGRLVPVPFDPSSGLVDESVLVVSGLRPGADVPFRRGDRFLKVGGQTVNTRTELDAALQGVALDDQVRVIVERGGEHLPVTWVPFPSSYLAAVRRVVREQWNREFPAGGLVNAWIQFGFMFAAYPLRFSEANRIVQGADGRRRFELPGGSYLLVARKSGYEDIRYPVSGDLYRASVRLEMMESAAIPSGFIFVPEGPVALGGETHPQEFQSHGLGEKHVDAFFLAEREVTFDDWLDFLNHEDVRGAIDEQGRLPPRSPELSGRRKAVLVLPSHSQGSFVERDDGGLWSVTPRLARSPVVGLSFDAALEYVHWRNQKSLEDGDRWSYRLPTSFEWERAARGVDRRAFVWGNYRIWCHCLSLQGNPFRSLFSAGSNPFDESIFGVRDMNGSASELTDDRPAGLSGGMVAHRGGAWNLEDDMYFLLVNRNGIHREAPNSSIGLRLVAYREEGQP